MAAGAGMTRAAPRAKAMKGAVQGAATTTASTPVKKAPDPPGRRDRREPPSRCSPPPISKAPARFSATASIRSASPATTAGDWSWKPQPIACPPARKISRTAANRAKLTSTPAVKARPSRRASAGAWAERVSDAAFIARTGKTHGIRLRISPPRRARPAACSVAIQPVSGVALTCPQASGVAVKAPAPAAPASGAPGSAVISQAPAFVDSTPDTGPLRPVFDRSTAAASSSVTPCGPR